MLLNRSDLFGKSRLRHHADVDEFIDIREHALSPWFPVGGKDAQRHISIPVVERTRSL